MSDTGSTEVGKEFPGNALKKHRHDLGHEDHGPKIAAGTTRAIQAVLGLWIALTLVFVVYALVDASRPKSDVPTTAPSSEAAPAAPSGGG